MADYKGLTIKIGGDTSGLSAALRAAGKAASQTQSQLRAVEKSLRFDPGSVSSTATKMKLVENRAESLTAQLKTVNAQYRELGGKASLSKGAKSIGELASETRNAALQAQLAQTRYNAVDSELADLYSSINKVARASENFGRNFDIRKEADIEGSVSALRELGLVTEEQESKVKRLRASWQSAFNELSDAKAVKELQDMQVKAQGLTSEIKSLDAVLGKLQAPSALAASFRDAEAEIKRIDGVISQLKAQMKSADDALRLDPQNMDAARSKMQALAQVSELAGQKAELLKKAIAGFESDGLVRAKADSGNLANELSRAQAEVQKLSGEYREASADAQRLESEMKQLAAAGELPDEKAAEYRAELSRVTSEAQQLEDALGQASKRAQALGDATRLQGLRAELSTAGAEANGYASAIKQATRSNMSWGSTVKSMGMTLSATLTPALTLAGGYAVQSARDMDSAYRDMRKTVNGTEADFERLRQSAIDFSKTNFTSAETMMQIQAIGGELGVATDALDTFAKTVANLDIATNLDSEEAATGLGQLANIMGDLGEKQMPNFADALVRLGNNGASTESQIMDIAKRIGSMGSIVGMSTPDILAWASTIASTGQNAEAAGTAISKTMSNIETAVSKGGASLQGFAKVAGMSAREFASTWKGDPTEAMKAFIEGLNGIEEKGGSADKTLGDLGIKATRQKQAIMGLMQSIGLLGDNLEMSGNAWNGVGDQWGAAGDAAREADAKARGFSGSMQRLANIAQDVASSLADAVAPVLADVADGAAELADWFDGLSESERRQVAALAAVAAAAGPIASLVGTIVTSFKAFGDAASKAHEALPRLAKSLASLKGGAMGEVAADAGKASAGIGGLASKLGALATAHPAAAAGITLVGGALAALAAEAYSAYQHQQLLNEATRPVSEIMEGAAESAEGLADSLASIDTDGAGALQSLKSLNDETRKTFESYEKSAAKAGYFLDTILDLAEGGKLSAVEQERLKQAVEGYNKATGESVGITDAATGRLSVSTEQLRKNTEEWLRNAKAQAMQGQAQKYLEQMVDNQMKLDEAQRKYSEALKGYDEATSPQVRAVYAAQLADMGVSVEQARQQIDDLTASTVASAGAADYLNTQQLLLDGTLKGSAATMAEAVMAFGQTAMGALYSTGVSTGQLVEKLAAAGVSTQQLNAIGSANFTSLAAICQGNIGMMVAAIGNYNAVPIVDKDGRVTADTVMLTDAQGKVYVWNGTELIDKDGKVTVDVRQLSDGKDKIVDYDAAAGKITPVSTEADAKGNVVDGKAKKGADDYKKSSDALKSKDIHAKAEGNVITGSAKKSVDDMVGSLGNLQSKTVTVTANTYRNIFETTTRRTVSTTAPSSPGAGQALRSRMLRASPMASRAGSEADRVSAQVRALAVDAAVINSRRDRERPAGTVRTDNSRTTNIRIDGITYDDGSNVAQALDALMRALRIERRR